MTVPANYGTEYSQYVIDKLLILCDVITPLPVYHVVNIERREGEC